MDALYSKIDALNQPSKLREAKDEAERLFRSRANRLGFTDRQAYFLWHYVLNAETRRKMMNLVTGIQKEKDFRM